MVEVRACVYISVIFLCFHIAIGKPFVGIIWCEVACVDDNDALTTTPRSPDDDIHDVMCGACPPNRRRNRTQIPLSFQVPFNVLPAPTNGSLWQPTNDGSWWINFVPSGQRRPNRPPQVFPGVPGWQGFPTFPGFPNFPNFPGQPSPPIIPPAPAPAAGK